MYANLFSRESGVKKIPAKAIILCHFASIGALTSRANTLEVNFLFVDVLCRNLFFRIYFFCRLCL